MHFARAVSWSLVIGVVAALALNAPGAHADAGDWLVRVGAHYVEPKSDNHDLVSVDGATAITFNATYFMTANWAVEVLAALPFEHDIDLNGGPRVGSTRQLPPTFSLQYHFLTGSRVRPYIGAGLNWTMFFEEDTTGPINGADLELDDSFGIAAQVGVDIDLTDALFLNIDARYMEISSSASINGVGIGDVEIDPWAAGVSLGYRF